MHWISCACYSDVDALVMDLSVKTFRSPDHSFGLEMPEVPETRGGYQCPFELDEHCGERRY